MTALGGRFGRGRCRADFGGQRPAAPGIKTNVHPTENISNGGPASLSNQTG